MSDSCVNARAAAMLRHDNICAIHDVQETGDGHVFIVMPLYEGRSLKEMLTGGPLSEEKALSFARQIASGLKAAHEKGLTHRDVKPANLWVTDEERIKILDFGLAKLTGEQDLTKTSSTVGTMAYMAPEQVQNHPVDSRADLWSLGIVLYEMLTGRRPFTGEYEAAVVYGIVNQEVDLEPVPGDVRGLVKRLLAKDPESRYASAQDVLTTLDGLLVADKLGSAIHESAERKEGFGLPSWWKSAAAALVILVAGLTWMASRQGESTNGSVTPTEVVTSVPTVGVMYFENNTERRDFGTTIRSMLARNLGQVDSLNVISNQRLGDILRLELGSSSESIDAASATAVARQAGITTMIIGAVTQFGEQIVLEAELTDVESGSIMDAVSVTAENYAAVIEAMNDLTAGILQGSGKTGSGESGQIRIQNVSTDVLTAYEWFERGSDHLNEWRFAQAQDAFSQAIEQDSTFMAAHLLLYRASSVFAFEPDFWSEPLQEILNSAERHIDHATAKEKEVLAFYKRHIESGSGNAPDTKAVALADKYPDDKFLQLEAGLRTVSLERFDYFQRAIDLDPTYGPTYNMLGYDYMFAGRTEEAISSIRRYLALQPNVWNAMDSAWEVMVGAGREDLALETLDRLIAEDGSLANVAWRLMYTHAIIGDTVSTWRDWQAYTDLVSKENRARIAAFYEGYGRMLFGQWEAARVKLAAYLREYRRFGSDEQLMVRLRRDGDILHALGRHEEAERRYDEMVEISRQVSPSGFNPYPFLSAHDQAMAYADAGNLDQAKVWLERMETTLENSDFGLDDRHGIQADIARGYVAFVEEGVASVDSLIDIPIWTRYLSPQATLMYAWKELASGNVEGARRNMSFVEHNVGAKNFSISPYSTFFIYSPTARYRTGKMFEAFEMKKEAIEAYESAMERFEQTGATFKYVALTRERLEALRAIY